MVPKLEKTETLALVAMLWHLWHLVQRTGILEKKTVHCCGLKVKLESFFSLEGENITSREEQKIFYCIITLAF